MPKFFSNFPGMLSDNANAIVSSSINPSFVNDLEFEAAFYQTYTAN